MKNILAKLLGVPAAIWNFYAPLLRELTVTGVSVLLPVALDIVRNLATSEKTGAEKRIEAIDSLKAVAVRQGLSASESLIRFTVESAVQRLKMEESR
jgi:hypothetical protein